MSVQTNCTWAMLQTWPFPKQAQVLSWLQCKSLKTTWEKEKLLINSNFSFSRSVFYMFREFPAKFSSISKLLDINSFSLEESKICLGQV